MSFELDKALQDCQKDINKTLDEFPKRFAERFRETMLQRYAAMSAGSRGSSANSSTSSNPNNHIYTSYPACYVGLEDLRRVVREELAPIYKELEEIKALLHEVRSHQKSGIIKTPQPLEEPKLFYWGGKVHFVPENFTIPQDTPMALWRLWIYGDVDADADGSLNRRTNPYRHIESASLPLNQRAQFSKVKGVMTTVMESIGKSYDELEVMSRDECEKLFYEHYKKLVGDFKNADRANTSTVYEVLRRKKREVRSTGIEGIGIEREVVNGELEKEEEDKDNDTLHDCDTKRCRTDSIE